MASGFFAILDDIAALMDDVAVNAKLATKKTAGILGDDLAVNAEKSTGFVSNRELPVLWAITKGSFVNKIIIVPLTLLLQVYLPIAIIIILILGGFFLAYEGVEKIIEYLFHRNDSKKTDDTPNENQGNELEKAKIKSAVTTDFILSVEIVIIALSSVLDQPLSIQILTLSIVSILATVGVYGLVALIVRMDDLGYRFIAQSKGKGLLNTIGELLVNALPWVIKSLALVGTIALLLVSGGIFSHNIPFVHHWLTGLPDIFREFIFGILGGIATVGVVTLFSKIINSIKK